MARKFLGIFLLTLLASQASASDPIYQSSESIDCALVQGVRDCDAQRFSDGRSANQIVADRAEQHRDDCQAVAAYCLVEVIQTDGNLHAIGTMYGYESPPPDCEAWHHEGRNDSECGTCDTGYVDAGSDVMPRCQLQETQEACAENGEFYEQAGYCITECASGSALGNICLENPEAQCDSGSDDYLGNIGFGGNQTPVCGDNQCPNGGTYGFKEQADGSYQSQCLPPDANPPECPAGSAVIVGSDNISFQCNQINFDRPDDDPNGDNESDGDSDGDGEGDISGITGQLNDIKKLLGKGNTNTNNINETLKGIGKSIKDGTGALKDAIGNIPGGGGGSSGGKTEIVGEDGNAITWTGQPIDTELKDPGEDYDQVMADYQAKINSIKSEVKAMFGTNLSGGGTVDDNIKTIHGVNVNFSLNRFLDGLNILGAIVLFCAAFISAGILFSGRG